MERMATVNTTPTIKCDMCGKKMKPPTEKALYRINTKKKLIEILPLSAADYVNGTACPNCIVGIIKELLQEIRNDYP
jgi:hypothetical protein